MFPTKNLLFLPSDSITNNSLKKWMLSDLAPKYGSHQVNKVNKTMA